MKRRDWDGWWQAFARDSFERQSSWPVFERSKLNGKSVLDAGCGVLDGYVGQEMSPSFLLGADYSDYGIKFARQNKRAENFAICDIASLPFAGGSFDVVVSEAVLPHMAFSFESAVREIARVSRESLFISTLHYEHYDFLDMERVETRYGKVFRSHYFGTDEYMMEELLAECGFRTAEVKVSKVIEKGSFVKSGLFVEAIRK